MTHCTYQDCICPDGRSSGDCQRGLPDYTQAAQSAAVPEHIRSIKIPTDAMEQEFQKHYRRGYEAGKGDAVPVVGKHPSHVTRSSDASSFDEVCINCGAKDITGAGWGDLANQCKQSVPVVGEVAAFKYRYINSFGDDVWGIRHFLPGNAIESRELIEKPTTSITAAELDALRKGERDREVGAAIQRAAKELPEGCDISIRIENGSACVELYLSDTDASFDMDVDADNRLAAEIHAAVDAAIAGEKKAAATYAGPSSTACDDQFSADPQDK